MSDYRLEYTLLDGPWPNRLPVTSIAERQAATRLLGAALTLVIPGPADPTGAREPWATRVTVLQVSPGEPRSQRALLRLDSPLVYGRCAYSYAVAYLRCDGESLDRLVTAGEFFCSVKGLPVEQVESATPFDHHQWPAGAPQAAALRLP